MSYKSIVIPILKCSAEGAIVEVSCLELFSVVLVNDGTKTIGTVRRLVSDNIVVSVEQSEVSARLGVGYWRTEK